MQSLLGLKVRTQHLMANPYRNKPRRDEKAWSVQGSVQKQEISIVVFERV